MIEKYSPDQPIIRGADVIYRPAGNAGEYAPLEVIALALNGTQWVPGRPVQDGDMVIYQTLRLLRQAGYAIVPATKGDDK